jgi:hypothetical protein
MEKYGKISLLKLGHHVLPPRILTSDEMHVPLIFLPWHKRS